MKEKERKEEKKERRREKRDGKKERGEEEKMAHCRYQTRDFLMALHVLYYYYITNLNFRDLTVSALSTQFRVHSLYDSNRAILCTG